jgi:uncharacterized membrane protein (DUF2068 family)
LVTLRLIAIFKFGKAILVIATGLGLLSFFNADVVGRLYQIIGTLPYQFEQRLLRDAIDFLSSLSPVRLRTVALATLTYSGLFIVEGVGLWLGLHWAEILTVIATSSLIPIEVYEVWHKRSIGSVVVLLLNALILVYLLLRLKRERAAANG